MAANDEADKVQDVELDYQLYKSLLDLWSKENPIKTAKLQVLLAVNALLVKVSLTDNAGPRQKPRA